MRLPAKIVVVFERRADGGLRAYSDDVPGFVLSHSDLKGLLQDVRPALEGILSHIFKEPVVVEEISRLREQISGFFDEQFIPPRREYVTRRAA